MARGMGRPMTPTPEYRIMQGNALQVLPTLPEASVNCCVTSPPYWGLRSYGTNAEIWGGAEAACEHEWGEETFTKGPSGSMGSTSTMIGRQVYEEGHNTRRGHSQGAWCQLCGAWRGAFGLEPTPELYVEHAVLIFRQVRRVLRDDGTLWLNIGDCYATGAGNVGECPGGGKQGARWTGRARKDCDPKRGPAAPGQPKGHPVGVRPNLWAGQHPGRMKQNGIDTNSGAQFGPMVQPNRLPIPGLKPKDLIMIPHRLALALQADGWWVRMDNVWAKPNCMPESIEDRPTKSHEYCFLLSKSEHYYYDHKAIMEPLTTAEKENYPARARATGRGNQGFAAARGNDRGKSGGFPPSGDARNKRSVWWINTVPFKGAHFAVMPEELAKIGILAGCPAGGAVLDPFAGSGTVGVVAMRHGRRFLGIELEEKYVRMAHRRIFRSAPLHLHPEPPSETLTDLPLFAQQTP